MVKLRNNICNGLVGYLLIKVLLMIETKRKPYLEPDP